MLIDVLSLKVINEAAKRGEFRLERVALHKDVQELEMGSFPSIEYSLCISTTIFLEWPGLVSVEFKLTDACGLVCLVDEVAVVHSGVSIFLFCDGIDTVVGTMDFATSHEV